MNDINVQIVGNLLVSRVINLPRSSAFHSFKTRTVELQSEPAVGHTHFRLVDSCNRTGPASCHTRLKDAHLNSRRRYAQECTLQQMAQKCSRMRTPTAETGTCTWGEIGAYRPHINAKTMCRSYDARLFKPIYEKALTYFCGLQVTQTEHNKVLFRQSND